jgi:hypothetical protein
VFSLQPSTSNVDEGDPGKVKGLYDLVFEEQMVGAASGISIPAKRGGSLDIGVLHTAERDTRKKCSIEFWFYLPSLETVVSEIILVRRTMGEYADDLAEACLASNKESLLWELALRSTGDIIFRTCGKSELTSTNAMKDPDVGESSSNDVGSILFERWNHICVILSSKGLDMMSCTVAILVKGVAVVSSNVSMLPPGVATDHPERDSLVDDALEKSHILFGLNHPAGFRLTELRIWACARKEDDIKSFLYEYLTAAEQKKKFTVKITNKHRKVGALPKLGMKGMDTNPNIGNSILPPRMIPMKSSGVHPLGTKFLIGTQAETGGYSNETALSPTSELKPMAPTAPPTSVNFETSDSSNVAWTEPEHFLGAKGLKDDANDFEAGKEGFPMALWNSDALPQQTVSSVANSPPQIRFEFEFEGNAPGIGVGSGQLDDTDAPTSLWETAAPLSLQIRSSAAAAVIRGPPATRHFGGNRGGLPDFSGMERFGVGGIAISGSDKTIVYRDNEEPPALTYPIGASGAIISDQMNDEGNEFLCCFLAKDRKLVIFELRSRTVVVELQMATKLNYWRFLPYEAAGSTLCFVLIRSVTLSFVVLW